MYISFWGETESEGMSPKQRRAAIPPVPGKTRITIRLDNEVLDWFRAQVDAKGGGSYQAMINDTLRSRIEQGEEGLEALLRRVIREELGIKASEGALFSLPAGNL
jgi:uncharacterized protein (DUF4415 family)